jgi:hypothetical protein
MRGLKIQNVGETKRCEVYIKENYADKGKVHLNHQELYSAIISDKILLALRNI